MRISTNISQMCLLALATLLWTGCAPNVSQTVAVPGLTPVDPSRVTVVEKLEDTTKRYQIVGRVYAPRNDMLVSDAESDNRLCKLAAGMGADGVIGIHRMPGFVSALAVKWLSPGEPKKPLALPFVVAFLPMANDPSVPGNQAKVSEAVRKASVELLEQKGYYLLSPSVTGFQGGLDRAKQLDAAALNALGGEDANRLLEVEFTRRAETNLGLVASSSATVRARLLDKRTKQIVYQGEGDAAGGGFSPSGGLIATLAVPDEKRIEAAIYATARALKDLPPVSP